MRIPAGHKKAANAIVNSRDQSANCCRDDGCATGLRFDRHEAEGFRVRWNNADICRAVPVGKGLTMRRRFEAHEVTYPQ